MMAEINSAQEATQAKAINTPKWCRVVYDLI